MSRRRRGDPVHGVVLLDKPAGLSSNQALQRVRRLFNAQKAGHTGTLDPFATGLLPVCLGEATKTTAFLLDADKAYRAEALLGEATSTGDLDGEPVHTAAVPAVTAAELDAVLARFTGDLEQVPPMYSALKHEGRPLYEYARRGIDIPRKARPVTIHALERVEWTPPRLVFDVVCSKGTYVRTLAEDIAGALGTVAHLVALRRLRTGPFAADRMVSLATLEAAAEAGRLAEHLLPVDAGLADWPRVRLDAVGAAAFRNGNPAAVPETELVLEPGSDRGSASEPASSGTPGIVPETGWVRVCDTRGRPLGLGEIRAGEVRPKRVFQQGGENP